MIEHRELDGHNAVQAAPQLQALKGNRDAGNRDFDGRQRQHAAAFYSFERDRELHGRRFHFSGGVLPPSITRSSRVLATGGPDPWSSR